MKVAFKKDPRLLELLQLTSAKIYERFKTVQKAFRYFDTDHSQALSVNEFAQGIEFLRLKFSFNDIVRLFKYLDKTGSGAIGYEEFTLLTEERWRGIDPFANKYEGEFSSNRV